MSTLIWYILIYAMFRLCSSQLKMQNKNIFYYQNQSLEEALLKHTTSVKGSNETSLPNHQKKCQHFWQTRHYVET